MNHVYRSVWSDITGTFVAAAETIKGRGKRSSSAKDSPGAPDAVDTAVGSRSRGIVLPGARLIALEQRYMFDGAGAVDAVHTLHVVAEPEQQSESGLAFIDLSEPPPSYNPTDDRGGQNAAASESGEIAQAQQEPQSTGQLSSDATPIAQDTQLPRQWELLPSDLLSSEAAQNLDAALASANQLLLDLADSERFLEIAREVFGQASIPPDGAFEARVAELAAQIRSGGLGIGLELRGDSELNGAAAGYAAVGHTGAERIYLNADWVADAPVEMQVRVLLEELGHAIDQRLNAAVDTEGDEGELFSARIVGKNLDGDQRAAIQIEKDRATLVLDHREIDVELASSGSTTASLNYVLGDAAQPMQTGVTLTRVSGETHGAVSIRIANAQTGDRITVGTTSSAGSTPASISYLASGTATGTVWIATVQWNYTVGTDTITFVQQTLSSTNSDNLARQQALLRAMSYSSTATAETAPVAARTVTFTAQGSSANATFTQTLTVSVPNAAPIITSNDGGNTASVSVAENQQAVTSLVATDSNGDTITYAIAGGVDASKFEIVDGNKLQFKEAPNFEAPIGNAVVVGTSTASFGAVTSGTLTLPAGLQQGDIVIIGIGSDAGGGPALPAGWTSLNNAIADSSGTGMYSRTAYKVMGATPDTTVSFTGISTASAAYAVALRGLPATFSAAGITAADSGAADSAPNAPSVTSSANGIVLAIAYLDDDDVATAVVAPSNYTLLTTAESNTTASTTDGATVMVAYRSVVAAGSEDPGNFSGTGVSDRWVALSIPVPAVNRYEVVVQASDGKGGTDAQTLTVNVTDVNEAPSRTAGVITPLRLSLDAGSTSLGLGALDYSAVETGQTLVYTVTGLPTTIGSITLSDGTLVTTADYTLAQIRGMKFVPAANALAGTGTFSFRVTDNGTTNAQPDPRFVDESLQISVTYAAPTLTLGTGVAGGATAAEATAGTGVVTVTGPADTTLIVTLTGQNGTVMKTLPSSGSSQAVVLAAADVATLGNGTVQVSAVTAVNANGDTASNPATLSFVLDTRAPAVSTAGASGTRLVIQLTEPVALSGALTAAQLGNLFTVDFGSIPISVSSAQIDATGREITLTLASDVNSLDVLQLSYVGGAAVRDLAGNNLEIVDFNVSTGFQVAESQKLVFDTKELKVGTGQAVNDVVVFRNVINVGTAQVPVWVDAVVTTVGLNSATISDFDSTANPYANTDYFQPSLNIGAAGGSATFRFDFIRGGSYVNFANIGERVTLKDVVINSYDLDGAGGSAAGRQFTDFSGFSAYWLASNTQLSLVDLGDGTSRFVTTVGGNVTALPGTAEGDRIRVRVTYDSVGSLVVRIGDTSATGIAYYGLDFSLGPTFQNLVELTGPSALDDVFIANSGSVVTGNVITNDTQGSNSGLSIASVNGTAFASLVLSTDSTYTSDAGYRQVALANGVLFIKADGTSAYRNSGLNTAGDSFTYQVAESRTKCNTDLLN